MQDITDNSDVEKVLVHYFIFLDYLKLIHFMSITVPMLTVCYISYTVYYNCCPSFSITEFLSIMRYFMPWVSGCFKSSINKLSYFTCCNSGIEN